MFNFVNSLEKTLSHAVNTQDKYGNSLLHLAILQIDKAVAAEPEVRKAAVDIAKLLLSQKVGGDLNLKNKQGFEPIKYAQRIINKDDRAEVLLCFNKK